MIDQILNDIIAAEGGWTDHPADRGGPTNWGITLPTLTDYLGRPATVDDIRTLTVQDAKDIYRSLYIERPGFGAITDGKLLSLVVDMAVNHGVTRVIKLLQRALRLDDDGIFGPKTKAALTTLSIRTTYLNLVAERIRFYGRLISKDHSQAVFASGWLNRAAKFVEIA